MPRFYLHVDNLNTKFSSDDGVIAKQLRVYKLHKQVQFAFGCTETSYFTSNLQPMFKIVS